jgi:DNA-binding NarL/FixJ family response regulator
MWALTERRRHLRLPRGLYRRPLAIRTVSPAVELGSDVTLVVLAVSGGVVAAGLDDVLRAAGCELHSAPADELATSLRTGLPDAVVLDRDDDGLATAARLSHAFPDVAMVVVSAEDQQMTVFPANRPGPPYTTLLTEDRLVAATRRQPDKESPCPPT